MAHRGVLARDHVRGTFFRGIGNSVDARYIRFRNPGGDEMMVLWLIYPHDLSAFLDCGRGFNGAGGI